MPLTHRPKGKYDGMEVEWIVAQSTTKLNRWDVVERRRPIGGTILDCEIKTIAFDLTRDEAKAIARTAGTGKTPE